MLWRWRLGWPRRGRVSQRSLVPSGKIFGFPPFPFFLFGVLGLSGAVGDFE